MSIHGFHNAATDQPPLPVAPLMWRRSRVDLSYPALAFLDPLREGLSDVPGVVVVWDAQDREEEGSAGRCIYVGQTRDLATAVRLLREDPALVRLDHGGLRITWAPIGIAHRPGVVAYLRDMLNPAVAECGLDARWPVRSNVRPVPVQLPN
jgi:hypothetical protein